MGDRDDKDVGRDPEFKVFVGGISWQFKDADLKEAFSRYDPADAQCILGEHVRDLYRI